MHSVKSFIDYLPCWYQACAFRDSYEKFKKAGAEVVGISGDSSESHKVILIRNQNKYFKIECCLLSERVKRNAGICQEI